MWELVSLHPLGWLLALVAMMIGLRYSLVDRPRWLWGLSSVFRALSIGCLVIALCRPFAADESNQLHVNFLVDISQSVDLEGIRQVLPQIETWIEGLRPGDSWHLFAIGNGVRQFQSIDALRAMLDQWQTGVADDQFRSATQIASALLATRLSFPAGKYRRIVLLSDGLETKGDLSDSLKQLGEEGIDVLMRPLAGLAATEAAVLAIWPSSQETYYGEISRLGVQLAANRSVHGTLRIIHKGVSVQQQEIDLKPGSDNRFYFEVAMHTPGDSVWTAELIPDEDHFPINNQSSCTITVRGRPRVLLLHEDTKEMRSFTRALRKQEIDTEVRGLHGLPESLSGMAAFDAIVLANLPATMLSPAQMQMIKSYVTDLGGGLAMFGSENSFGLGGYYKTPVEDVLPLVSRYEKEKEKPSLAMVLVIDKSGSMSGIPIQLARQAAKAAVELLGPRDSIGVVGFDGQPQVICEMISAAEVDSVQASIDSLAAGGGTYMYPAMVVGKEMLENTPAKIRHMICLSDGRTQPADHESLAEEMADAGITISTVALGSADQQLMSLIAEIGRGRYYETNDPGNVPQIFTKETMQATKSAIKEDLFGSVPTTDHPLLSGYHDVDLPFTLGYVMTEVKPTAQLLLAVETGDPLLAVGRYGLGNGLAYTSDLTEKWGGEWLAWDDCGKFWGQALRAIMRKNSTEGLQISTRQQADGWHLDIHRSQPNASPINGIAWDAALLDDRGNNQAIAVKEVGLGRYQTSIAPTIQQRTTLRLRDKDYDITKLLHFHQTYPVEYRLGQDLPAAIASLPKAPVETVVLNITPARRLRSTANYAYFAALASLLLSIFFRRL
ncbi:MAG: VWA domain-containing protein [Pirellulales bacterium]